MLPILKPEEFLALPNKHEVVLVDVRTGPKARQDYVQAHLAGALFVDLEQDLSGPRQDPSRGGRHPLPDLGEFAAVLSKLGITPESYVLVYDDKMGANAAARFWWMLRAVGHQRVQVLDGGLQAGLATGVPAGAGEEKVVEAGHYPVQGWLLPTATVEEVAKAVQEAGRVVVDVRDAYRYRGESEPIDPIAGHIPQAINIPFAQSLDEEGRFRSADQLKSFFESALGGKSGDQVIVHCGSGVTACHSMLAMVYAGLEMPVLYVGSWSEWSGTNRPIARETDQE